MTKTVNFIEEISQNFLDYAHEVNCQRAFADARDGLKPGQRACLWEMYTKGYLSNKPHVKSAKVSGGTIATWWPHGDQAIYDTFARMSQTWINNIPEVDWHGANGSIQISGEPAASRYTEVRLSKTTEQGLLQNIKKQNVPMKLNFSEDEEWPEVFPALYPRLIINGCQGIGSTIANCWLPHSLTDIAKCINSYIATSTLNFNELAPDFPTGGIIINKDELSSIYKTGKGKVILRAKTEIKDNLILITEVPYQVYIEPLIDQIKKLVASDEITGISNIYNKSDKKRLLIEIECYENPNQILFQLFKKTNLQKSYSANQFALVERVPKLLTLKEYLDIFLEHNYECIKREYQYDLNKAKDRLEIVEGLIHALEDIDNIIKLIKQSENSSKATDNLIIKYDFTKRQAKAIVDMKLGRLARLEKVKLNEEKKELTSTIEKCTEIINNNNKRKELYLERFNNFVKKYGEKRHTQLINLNNKNIEEEKKIESIDVIVTITKTGMIKKIPTSKFKIQHRNTKGVKSGKDILMSTIKTNTVDYIMFFSNIGKMYRTCVNDIPDGTNTSLGMPISNLVQLSSNEEIIAATSLHKENLPNFALFFTKQGMIKKTLLSEYFNAKKKTGIVAIKLRNEDMVTKVIFQNEEDVIVITKKGMNIRFATKDIKPTGRTTLGVKAIKLIEEDEILTALSIHDEEYLAVFTSNGNGKKMPLKDFIRQNRGGRGLVAYKCTPEIKLAESLLIKDTDNILINGNKNLICISAKEVPLCSKTALGNVMIKNNNIITVTKI